MLAFIRTLRFALSTALWRAGDWLAGLRGAVATKEQVQRQAFGLRGANLRMTERVRDKFRGDWLRIRGSDDSRP